MVLHRSHHRRTHRGWERNDAFPVMFAALVCIGLWLGFHAPRARRPRPDRRRHHGLRRGVRRSSTTSTSTAGCAGSATAACRGLERLAAAHDVHHRFGGAPYGMLVPVVPARAERSAAAGRGRPTSLTTRTARSGRTAPRRTSARHASGARRRGGRGDAANARIAATSRPQAERAEPADGQLADAERRRAGRRRAASSALTGGPAARKRRHAAHADVGAREHGDRAVAGAAGEAVEHVDAAPRAVAAERPQPDVVALDDAGPPRGVARGSGRAPPRRSTRRTSPCAAGRPTGRCRRRGRCRAGGGTRARAAGAGERSPSRRIAVSRAVVAHEVERRDAGHGTCWHRACAGSGSPCPAVAGYLLGSIPTAVIVGRRRHVDLRAGRRPQPGVVERQGGARAARGAAGPRRRHRQGRRPAPPSAAPSPGRGEWWPGYVGGAAAMVGHAWPLFARFRGGRGVATLGGAAGVLAPAAGGAWRSPPASSSGAATDSTARGIQVGFAVFPVAQVVVDGPRRTAATGALMSLVGLRFWMAGTLSAPAAPRPAARRRSSGRARRRRRRRRAATASRRRRAGCRRRAVPTSVPARTASRATSSASARRATTRTSGSACASATVARPATLAGPRVDAGQGERAAPAVPRLGRRLVHPHRQQVGGVEVADGEAGGGHRPHERDVLDGVVGDGAEAAGGAQRRRAGPPCTGRCRSAGGPGPGRRAPGGAVR